MAEFNYYRFHRRRQVLKTAGWVAVALGLFCVLDMFFKEPMPLRGRNAVFAGPGFAGHRWRLVECGLQIAHRRSHRDPASTQRKASPLQNSST
jgi:hypothetical protein